MDFKNVYHVDEYITDDYNFYFEFTIKEGSKSIRMEIILDRMFDDMYKNIDFGIYSNSYRLMLFEKVGKTKYPQTSFDKYKDPDKIITTIVSILHRFFSEIDGPIFFRSESHKLSKREYIEANWYKLMRSIEQHGLAWFLYIAAAVTKDNCVEEREVTASNFKRIFVIRYIKKD